jgi:hypothetical protein
LGPVALSVFLDNLFFIVAKSGDCPQEDLAKFGYKPNIKVNSLKTISIFFPALFEPCIENLWIFKRLFLNSSF